MNVPSDINARTKTKWIKNMITSLRKKVWIKMCEVISAWKCEHKKEPILNIEEIAEHLVNFDDQIRFIIESQQEKHRGNDELFYSDTVHRSLELLLYYLKMDYAWIWFIENWKFNPIIETWIKKYVNRDVIQSQVDELEAVTLVWWKQFTICPSDSKMWGVDAIFSFKNLKWDTVWYLLLDDIQNDREITDYELHKICEIFYDKIDKLIVEYQLTNAYLKQKNIQISLEVAIERSRLDHLTWLLNRQAWEEIFKQRLSDVTRWNTNVCIAYMDIDHFKLINDKYWHNIWDIVLKKVAEVINVAHVDDKISHIRRSSDDFVRIWWEEFMCILNHTDSIHAKIYTNKIRTIIENMKFQDENWNIFWITVSFWITQINNTDIELIRSRPTDSIMADIQKRADVALYEAKNTWRNMVIIFEELKQNEKPIEESTKSVLWVLHAQ